MAARSAPRATILPVLSIPVAIVLLVLALASGHVLANWLVARLLDQEIPLERIGLVFLLAFIFCVALLFVRRLHWNASMVVVAGCAVITGNTLAIVAQRLFDSHPLFGPRLDVALSAALLVLCVLALQLVRPWMASYRSLRRRPAEIFLRRNPIEVLFIHVSSNGPESAAVRDGKLFIARRPSGEPHELSAESLDHTIKQLAELREAQPPVLRWSWEPILRAIAPHLNRSPRSLQQIYLLGSSPSGQPGTSTWVPGSSHDLCVCKDILDHFLSKHEASGVRIELVTDLDFGGFDDLHDRVMHAILPELERNGVPARNVLIDITGGPKPTALAGVLSAVNDFAAFQYVQASPPYTVEVYHLRCDRPPRLG